MVLIKLTPEETLDILKALSRLDGYLMALPQTSAILCELYYSVELLSSKLLGAQYDQLH